MLQNWGTHEFIFKRVESISFCFAFQTKIKASFPLSFLSEERLYHPLLIILWIDNTLKCINGASAGFRYSCNFRVKQNSRPIFILICIFVALIEKGAVSRSCVRCSLSIENHQLIVKEKKTAAWFSTTIQPI